MLIVVNNEKGEPIALNTDRILMIERTNLVGICMVILEVNVMMDGRQARSVVQVKGDLRELCDRLNGRLDTLH